MYDRHSVNAQVAKGLNRLPLQGMSYTTVTSKALFNVIKIGKVFLSNNFTVDSHSLMVQYDCCLIEMYNMHNNMLCRRNTLS